MLRYSYCCQPWVISPYYHLFSLLQVSFLMDWDVGTVVPTF